MLRPRLRLGLEPESGGPGGVEACLDLPVCCRAEGVPRGQARLVDGLKASYLADTSGNLNP